MSMEDPEGLLNAALNDIAELTDRVNQLEDTEEEVEQLRDRVQRLEERTNMLRLIEEADQLDSSQRRAALWQHCVREAKQSRNEKIALNKDEVEKVLHHPDVHRTTLYTDMREVAEKTPEGVASYVPRRESESDETELRVDLTVVDKSVDASTLLEGER